MAARLSAADQKQRDQKMALEHALNLLPKEIAANHGVCRRTVTRALERWREDAPELWEVDPIDELSELRLQLTYAVSELAEMRGAGTTGKERTEAIRLQMGLWHELMELYAALGLLPKNDWNSPGNRFAFANDFKGWARRALEGKPGWDDVSISELGRLVDEWLGEARADE